jgi:hypothetical protein
VSESLETRDLCGLDDVRRYIPGYTPDPDTEATLQALISSLSTDAYIETGREFTPRRGSSPETRSFPIDHWCIEEREVPVGDLSTVDSNTVVKIVSEDGVVQQTLDSGGYVALPRDREPWEPVTSLYFPRFVSTAGGAAILGIPRSFSGGSFQLLQLTGVWGFPQLPTNVREAIAKLVIVRFVTDVAAAGTALTDALANINIAGLFRQANQSLDDYRVPVVG